MVEVSLPNTRHALPAYYIVAPAEASSNLARYDGVRYGLREPASDIVGVYEKTRAKGFGAEVRRRLMIGTYVLSAGYYDAYYVRAQKIRTLIRRDFERVFADGVDAVLTPATPSAAFGIGEKGSDDPVEMYLNDVFTVTVNMAGLPGLVAPAGLSSEGLPLGTAAHRPPVRRGDAVQSRRSDRAVGRPRQAARGMVVTMIAGPDDCQTLGEVRAGIDAVDDEIVALLARRMRYVERAAALKAAAGVAAHVPERRRQVMLRVEAAARKSGLAPDLAATLWTAIIDWATAREESLMAEPTSGDAVTKS